MLKADCHNPGVAPDQVVGRQQQQQLSTRVPRRLLPALEAHVWGRSGAGTGLLAVKGRALNLRLRSPRSESLPRRAWRQGTDGKSADLRTARLAGKRRLCPGTNKGSALCRPPPGSRQGFLMRLCALPSSSPRGGGGAIRTLPFQQTRAAQRPPSPRKAARDFRPARSQPAMQRRLQGEPRKWV